MAEALVMLIIYSSVDGDHWTLVEPEDVPKFLRSHECVERMVNGEGCQAPGSDLWYVGLSHEPLQPVSGIIQIPKRH